MVNKGVFAFVSLAVAGVLLLFVGCGGGSGNDNAPPTKEAFIREANQVCAEGEAEREEVLKGVLKVLGKNPKHPPSQAQKEEFILKLLPSYENEAQDLDELTPPEGDEKKVEGIVAAMEGSADRVKESPQTAITDSSQFAEANKLVEAYGLDKCTS